MHQQCFASHRAGTPGVATAAHSAKVLWCCSFVVWLSAGGVPSTMCHTLAGCWGLYDAGLSHLTGPLYGACEAVIAAADRTLLDLPVCLGAFPERVFERGVYVCGDVFIRWTWFFGWVGEWAGVTRAGCNLLICCGSAALHPAVL